MTPTEFETFLARVEKIPEVASGHVEFSLITLRADGIELGAIWSGIERGKGHAGRALKAFLDLADEARVDVYGQPHWLAYDIDNPDCSDEEADHLDALNSQKLDNDQLMAWYMRLGFEPTGQMMLDDPEIVRRHQEPKPTLSLG